jgi:DMSO/TMAO reductase YedYZ molybdopterin-dependent catalytic subunit
MSPEPFLAHSLNGESLTVHQGFPLRLIMPGWYGAPNVKWLVNVHLQEDPFVGKYQANWYRTLRGETIGGELKWTETAITRMRVKSAIARVTRAGDRCKVLGFALTDGTELESVEVQIDGGPWEAATVDSSMAKYSWKLFTYEWKTASPGDHTLVSRATDVHGEVQPTAAELENKMTFLEDNGQYPRTVRIS